MEVSQEFSDYFNFPIDVGWIIRYSKFNKILRGDHHETIYYECSRNKKSMAILA